MYLRELILNNYRNYVKLELNFNSNLIVFSGRNAQGKTNILESIFLSCTGRSHRTAKDKELIRWGEKDSIIKTLVRKKEGYSKIEIFLSSHDKKSIKINGMEAQRLGELMGHLNGVLFSPEDLKLVKGGPQERRRFMDMEISQVRPQYFYYLQRYNRVLNQRNMLLKEINKRGSLRRTLPAWNEQIADLGSYIVLQRHSFSENLKKIAKKIHRDVSAQEENLEIVYKPSVPFQNSSLDGIRKNLLESLEQCEEDDISRGSTAKGCHRDDLLFTINNADVRTYGSQGQQRTTVLSLKLSEVEMMNNDTGESPVLLLDDVLSELDHFRQNRLFEYLDNVQTFITMTDVNDTSCLQNRGMEIYEVDHGILKERSV